MGQHFIGKASEFENGGRRIVRVDRYEIGIFKRDDRFYAFSNYCLHQGGPACEGMITAKVEEKILPDKTSAGLYFSEDKLHFVCPWHGYEYDMATGECSANPKLKLRHFDVLQVGEDLHVVV